jgi:hypothetical protein
MDYLRAFVDQQSPLPTVPTFYQDVAYFIGAFVFFTLGDVFLKLIGYMKNDKNGRYFTLHVICNAYVTATTFDDVILTYQDPTSSFLKPCDSKAVRMRL